MRTWAGTQNNYARHRVIFMQLFVILNIKTIFWGKGIPKYKDRIVDVRLYYRYNGNCYTYPLSPKVLGCWIQCNFERWNSQPRPRNKTNQTKLGRSRSRTITQCPMTQTSTPQNDESIFVAIIEDKSLTFETSSCINLLCKCGTNIKKKKTFWMASLIPIFTLSVELRTHKVPTELVKINVKEPNCVSFYGQTAHHIETPPKGNESNVCSLVVPQDQEIHLKGHCISIHMYIQFEPEPPETRSIITDIICNLV